MKINITKKQYKLLMELLYLGNWTANASRDEEIEEYNEVIQYFLSFAKDFGMDDVFIYDRELAMYFPTYEYEEAMQPLIKYNDEDVFWYELSSHLAQKEMQELDVENMTEDEQRKKLFAIKEKYEKEFERNGLKNLEVKGIND